MSLMCYNAIHNITCYHCSSSAEFLLVLAASGGRLVGVGLQLQLGSLPGQVVKGILSYSKVS